MQVEDLETDSLKTTEAHITLGRLHINRDPSLKTTELHNFFGP